MKALLIVAGALGAALALSLWLYKSGVHPPDVVDIPLRNFVDGIRYGFRVERNVMVKMPDGVQLANNVYLPKKRSGPVGTVFVMLPYNKDTYSGALRAATYFGQRGYAVVVQDVRGKYASGGEFAPWRDSGPDAAATIDWIVQQPWSNKKVGTFGCSALGETQMILASRRHPHHAAMIAEGAGGAMGSAMGRHTYFGVFEGGIFNLASGFGWFVDSGQKVSGPLIPRPVDFSKAIWELPIVSLVARHRPEPTDYEGFLTHPPGDPWWREMGYIDDTDSFTTPIIAVNTWSDQTVADTLALAELARSKAESHGAPLQQHVIIAPGNHCRIDEGIELGKVGDFPIPNAVQPLWEWYEQWFTYWLKGEGQSATSLPPYFFYVMGEGRWMSADRWPPAEARKVGFFLDSGGHANTAGGDGKLAAEPPSADADGFDELVYDPKDPVPTVGGPICCTGNPADRAGPLDQRIVEARQDVLVYTSAPLERGLRIVGPVSARLNVSTSARDTDFVAKLVDVHPDGRALAVQEGALRLRYRNGLTSPHLAEPGAIYDVVLDMRATALYLPPGHRLRLQVSSSNFPRLERNLNTGGRNYDETAGVVARNRVHHGPTIASSLEVYVVD